jgi:hypothetical protein
MEMAGGLIAYVIAGKKDYVREVLCGAERPSAVNHAKEKYIEIVAME